MIFRDLTTRHLSGAALLGLLCACAGGPAAKGRAAPAPQSAAQAWHAGQEAQAVAIWKQQALAGDAAAWFNLGQAYRLGRGVTADGEAALASYRVASELGSAKALEQLGLLLHEQPETRTEGLAVLQQAAARGSAAASFVVGRAMMSGEGLAQNRAVALPYMEYAAQSGVTDAWPAFAKLRAELPASRNQQLAAAPDGAVRRRSSDLITVETGKAVTLGQLGQALGQASGQRVEFALSARDSYKLDDETHRLRVSFRGRADSLARTIADAFGVSVRSDDSAVVFTSRPPVPGAAADEAAGAALLASSAER